MSTLFISLKFSPGLLKEIIFLADSYKNYKLHTHLILDKNYKKMNFENPKGIQISFVKNKMFF